jgi:Circularly permutated YpsA SLOG family/Domain of unknown function (DUF6794)
MIKKIISGGQTGADQAALDAAIELGIPHGGWIPKRRLTERGHLSETYKLKEMPTASYPKRTEQNVLDSDATLIISHGKLTGGSALTKKLADKHHRPCLHIDLDATNPFAAVKAINYWLAKHPIEVLNVAGPRLSKDPRIYDEVKKILSSVLHLDTVTDYLPDLDQSPHLIPATVEEAVKDLISKIPLKDKINLAKTEESELSLLHPSLGKYIREQYGLWTVNKALMQSCSSLSDKQSLHPDDASAVIIRELWKALRRTHVLRAIK